MQHEQRNRPALRPVTEAELPPGRKALSPRWCKPDMAPGTTVLARRLLREHRTRLRAAGRMKKNPDRIAQREHRSWVNLKWQAMAKGYDLDAPWSFDRLFVVSTALH